MKKRYLFLAAIFLFFSCTTVKKIPEVPKIEIQTEEEKPNTLTLVFAGDIMAHKQNYVMVDYNKIWADVKDVTINSDFTFGNIEMPICDSLPLSTYPNFNVHSNYVQAAIDAGFNVFSLANNHSNDQYIKGIEYSKKYAHETEIKYSNKERKVYFAGLKNGEHSEFSYRLLEKDGWKIIYVPVTQLLNRTDFLTYINYVPSKKDTKAKFLEWCKELRKNNPCDLFILSLHTNEDEYVRSVSKSQENWYNQLLDAGIDIIWANHAHLIKKQRLVKESEYSNPTKLVMYANGNTISGQRTAPNLNLQFTERDDTGDGLLYKVVLEKDSETNKVFIKETERIFITTYINTADEFILKKLDDDFIDYLEENRPKWLEYIKARKKICEDIPELRE